MWSTIVLCIVGYFSRSISSRAEAGVSVERFPVISAINDEIEFQKLFRVLELQRVCIRFPVCSLHLQQMSGVDG